MADDVIPTNDELLPVDEDAIEMLKADHQMVRDLFQQYEASKDAETQRTIAEGIMTELERHAELEETLFYPTFADATDDEGEQLVEEAQQEHQTVKALIAELRTVEDAERFDAQFRTLMAQVQHHVEEEEMMMFPKAEEQLVGEMGALTQQMQELKQDLLTS
jgi:hemerythrin superfamily protein